MSAPPAAPALPAPIHQAIRCVAELLRRRQIPSPLLDARLLAQYATGWTDQDLLAAPHARASSRARDRLSRAAARRLAGEPVARILGRREFRSLLFALPPGVFDPRPDSETVIEAAHHALQDKPAPRILDLGAGTGCLLLALLHERPGAQGWAADRDPHAVRCARDNARRLALHRRARLFQGDWAAALGGPLCAFDLIIANPPYIPAEQIAALPREVAAYDPHAALNGGSDGLSAYRRLAPQLPALLAPDGRVILEIGQKQARPVEAIFARAGFARIAGHKDLAGHLRALTFAEKKLGQPPPDC